MEDGNSSRCSLLIFLVISGILSFINLLEFYNFINYWKSSALVYSPLFEECIKFDLIMKTVFSFFSLFASFSAFSITGFLIINPNLFIEKFSTMFLQGNYIIFGPILLCFSVLGLINIEHIVFSCDKNNVDNNKKAFSLSNLIAILVCFIVSFIITCIIEFFNSTTFFIDSILHKPSGNAIIAKLFWAFISHYRYRGVRSYNNMHYLNANNNNTNDLNNNDNNNNHNISVVIPPDSNLNTETHLNTNSGLQRNASQNPIQVNDHQFNFANKNNNNIDLNYNLSTGCPVININVQPFSAEEKLASNMDIKNYIMNNNDIEKIEYRDENNDYGNNINNKNYLEANNKYSDSKIIEDLDKQLSQIIINNPKNFTELNYGNTTDEVNGTELLVSDTCSTKTPAGNQIKYSNTNLVGI